MCQNWLLMDENEINKDAGKGPKLGGTADQHIRPCQIDDRGDFSFATLAEGACHETIF